MEDRELLELAAKAAGKRIHVWGTPGSENVADMDGPTGNRWNPLTDDGDALRLVVKLGLKIEHSLYGDRVYVGPNDTAPWAEDENYEQDRFAATRRAIVRAAAAIGKEM